MFIYALIEVMRIFITFINVEGGKYENCNAWSTWCGKGTQAKMIAEKYSIPHISTGDIFRANIKMVQN